MLDQFREEVVSKHSKGMQTAAYIAVNLVWFLLAVYAFLVFQSITRSCYTGQFNALDILFFVIPAGLAVLLFLQKDRVRTEYEYTFTNGQMDFAQVYNNKKRKGLGTMNLKNVEACGLVSSGSFHRYISMPGIQRTNWFLNRDAELLYFFFQKEGKKRIIIIEPSQEMMDMIKKALPQGVWQTN